MRIHAVTYKGMAKVVPVNAPGIGRSICIGLPLVRDGVVAVDAAVKANAFRFGPAKRCFAIGASQGGTHNRQRAKTFGTEEEGQERSDRRARKEESRRKVLFLLCFSFLVFAPALSLSLSDLGCMSQEKSGVTG